MAASYISMDDIRLAFTLAVREKARAFNPENADANFWWLSGVCDLMDAIDKVVAANGEKEAEVHGRYL